MQKKNSKSRKGGKRLFTVLIVCVIFFSCCGFSLDIEGTLKSNGKGSAVLTFESDKPLEEFKAELDKKISGYNVVSAANTQAGGNNMLVVRSVEETAEGYRVEIAFRRIDKIAVNGRFEYKKLSSYLKDYIVNPDPEGQDPTETDAVNYRSQTLVKWAKGDLTGISVDGLDKLLLFKDKTELELKAVPKTVSGETMEIDDFIEEGKKAGNRETILTFFILGIENVTSVQMTFPGKITAYAGENITIIGDNTVRLVPSMKKAQVKETGDTASVGYEKTGTLVGYIVYEKNISPVVIIGTVFLILLIVGLLVWGYIFLVRKGKDIQAAGKAQAEMSPFCVGWKAALKSETWKNVVKHRSLYLFVLPAVVLMILFNYAPMFGLAIAFQDYNITDGVFGSEFIGLTMFRQLFTNYESSYTYLSFRNTIFIALLRIVTNFPIILIAALFVNEIKSRKAKTLVTVVSYIPYFISWVAIGGMTYSLFAVDGIFNKLLAYFGMEAVNWYAEPDYWWPILTLSTLWKGLGWSTLIYLSGLGLINDELYEACRIDGGGKIRQALTVTIPGLLNTIVMQIILDVGLIMNDNYDQIRALTRGSEAVNERVLIVGGMEFFTTMQGRYTEGAAYGLVRGVIGLVMVLLANKLAKSTDNEGII